MSKEETTTLEVTKKQKDRIVDLMSKEAEVKPTKELTLLFQHERNNVKYGPGTVVVEAGLAASMFVQDQARYNNRLRENEGGDHLVEIVAAGHTRKIR